MRLAKQAVVIERITEASAPREAIEIYDEALRDIGAEYHAILLLPHRGEQLEDVLIAWEAPSDWRAFYLRQNLFQRDPALRQCRRSVMPFDWESSFYNHDTEFRWGEVLSRGRDFDIHKGIVVPVPSPAGVIGLVWSAGPHFDDRSKHVPYLHVLGLNVFHRLQQLGAAVKRADKLTPREREVMAYLSQGKTTWQIGYALRISRRLVEWHIDQACAKLGAADAGEAVARLERAERDKASCGV